MINNLPINEQPRERLTRYGSEVLSTRELLAVLLGSGTRRYPVLELAGQLLNHFQNSLILISKATFEELQQVPGIGPAKALELRAAFALATRLSQEKLKKQTTLKNPHLLARFLQSKLRDADQEEFHVVILNNHLEVIHCQRITQGLIDSCPVHAREVFRVAIKYNSTSIIIAHNHPSGRAYPSQQDITVTKELYLAGKIIGINLLDHIVLGEKCNESPLGYISFRENNIPPYCRQKEDEVQPP